jgi:type III secretory pathway component EscR
MRRRTFNAIGGWQPFLFCIGMYVVALFFSIFVCSSVFYAINAKSSSKEVEKTAISNPAKQQLASVNQ